MVETIHWRDWTEVAFAGAARDNKPILLSVITAWSEACAAMDAGTFADARVIEMANDRYVTVRVDADRRPDVSERYNLGGWPATAALTPDGDVLQGATYLGPEEMLRFLRQSADAWHAREPELRARAASRRVAPPRPAAAADRSAIEWFRSIVLASFDSEHGGFRSAVKLPHAAAIRFALALADEDADEEMRAVAQKTLAGVDKLWDVEHGGFSRYAADRDWTNPGDEKTLEDNSAMLDVLVDGWARLGLEEYRHRAGDLARWATRTMADHSDGGFFNSRAAVSHTIDVAMYIDRNAEMVGAALRAAAAFDDPWLRDFALKSFETVLLAGYIPGGGVAHEYVRPEVALPPIRGLLSDHIRTASALVWAHAVTGRLPYSMLAVELVQFAIRTMWDDQAGCFRDRPHTDHDRGLLTEALWPMALNCDAACVLDRLTVLTGDTSYHDRAMMILAAFADEYRRHGLFAAPYPLAVREVTEHRRPPGLILSRVEWHLEHD